MLFIILIALVHGTIRELENGRKVEIVYIRWPVHHRS